MTTIQPNQVPALGPWFVEAAKGIAVLHSDDSEYPYDSEYPWCIEVNNGLGGHGVETRAPGFVGAGAIIARCGTRMDAELVAAALWALVRQLEESNG